MVTTVDTDAHPHDPAAHARGRAMRGVDTLGPALRDPRATDRHGI
jgi:hypothetical protein